MIAWGSSSAGASTVHVLLRVAYNLAESCRSPSPRMRLTSSTCGHKNHRDRYLLDPTAKGTTLTPTDHGNAKNEDVLYLDRDMMLS